MTSSVFFSFVCTTHGRYDFLFQPWILSEAFHVSFFTLVFLPETGESQKRTSQWVTWVVYFVSTVFATLNPSDLRVRFGLNQAFDYVFLCFILRRASLAGGKQEWVKSVTRGYSKLKKKNEKNGTLLFLFWVPDREGDSKSKRPFFSIRPQIIDIPGGFCSFVGVLSVRFFSDFQVLVYVNAGSGFWLFQRTFDVFSVFVFLRF